MTRVLRCGCKKGYCTHVMKVQKTKNSGEAKITIDSANKKLPPQTFIVSLDNLGGLIKSLHDIFGNKE